ncbi:enoyl-CoA hydratase/isomerase [Pterulicium gracile]|uniref:Enoyl-CoA hydratase/isomerase n=1 Tax=Pterulicium gracile TaxID=1884261 RepID=A0A5C3Q8D8_9AGAR|nr:enoyl-CoA hydratase/isomerase [Pterula gracilis]
MASEWFKLSEPAEYVLLIQMARVLASRFWKAYGALFDAIPNSHPHIRAVILSSALPKIWTAGLDLYDPNLGTQLAPATTDPFRKGAELREFIVAFQHAIAAPERCPVPVIAAVHGLCIGLGIDVISACDIRYTADDAAFSIKVHIGLAADIGSLAYVPKITGNQSLIREFALSARMFNAAEAEKAGLVSRVVSGSGEGVVKAALETAKVIASKSPVAVQSTKHILLHSRDHSVADNLAYTATYNSLALQTQDLAECFRAVKAKQQPTFGDVRKKAGAKL